ncbi:extracellular solute-binding protein [Paenibacillus eucommiae]|uniref:Aldouronate transport system substrate-binding protein n=1 Tax=Paenibacillus eucommiae TaxID=1355755 RepID=A0ABS4J360_9BACL|nr:extracellular solute-binding protein [Paenibacillus eucommiae]MBP1994282.1 putative aldouronate transport system substrate-binding protein [Paenibacillus eucommiae]
MGIKKSRAEQMVCKLYSNIALILLVVAVLAGCSSSKENSPATVTPGKEVAEQTTNIATMAPAGETSNKFDPPVEVTMVNLAYGAIAFGPNEDMNNNRWNTYIKDHYGISVKSLWDAPGDQLEQKTNLMIATGNLPDIFLATPKQFVQLNNAGLIEDLTDVYEKYAPQNIKDIMSQAGQEVTDAATVKGRLMALPWTGSVKESVPVVWIREDWMKKLNLTGPKTMDDLLAIAKAFTTGDPDGNSKPDTNGLPIDKDFTLINAFLNGYHAYKDIWIKDSSGKLVYSSVQPELKTALAKLQEMYKAGEIDQEFGVKDTSKVTESIGSNKLGIFLGSMGGGNTLAALTPDVKWNSYPIPSIDGSQTLLQHPLNINYGFWVVKKGIQHPEVLYKLADAWFKLFYENKDEDIYVKYNSDQKTAFFLQAPVQVYKPYKNMETSIHLAPILESGKTATDEELSKLTPEERLNYGFIQKYMAGDQSFWKYASRSGIGGAGDIVSQYVQNNQFKPDQFVGAPTPTMVQKGAILQKMEDQMITKIITGAPIDQFDQFVAEWNKLGGEQMTQEVNDWYNNN